MDKPQPGYQLHLFTLDLWQESIGQGELEWRGRVKNTHTGAIGYFREWRELERLLLALVEEAGSADQGPPD